MYWPKAKFNLTRKTCSSIKLYFQSHKSVSRKKFGAFSRWHAGWVRQNVTDSASQAIDDWFMGKTADLAPNRTQRVIRNVSDKSPYRLFSKFVVESMKLS
jgi:hypothetical protein